MKEMKERDESSDSELPDLEELSGKFSLAQNLVDFFDSLKSYKQKQIMVNNYFLHIWINPASEEDKSYGKKIELLPSQTILIFDKE